MAGKDYYKTLNVERGASAEEVKKAFRKLAHEHHPDKKGGDASKFKEALEAYQVLSDTEKRQQYDQFGTTADQAAAGGNPFGGGFQGFNGGNVDFGDLSDVLNGMFGFGGRGGGGRGEARGRDIERAITLTFSDAVFGTTVPIEFHRYSTCERCKGNGGEPDAKKTTCKRCGGAGEMRVAQRTMFGTFETKSVCDECNGHGQVPETKCIRCHGEGVSREMAKLELQIPAGTEDGATLRVRGEGETAPRGGASGDLYLHLHVKSDPRFTRQGHDILSTRSIPFTTAALGGSVSVETVDGPVDLKIPQGTQSATQFRLRGKGVPSSRRGSRGDHLVTVSISVPEKISKKAKKLLEEFRDVAEQE